MEFWNLVLVCGDIVPNKEGLFAVPFSQLWEPFFYECEFCLRTT